MVLKSDSIKDQTSGQTLKMFKDLSERCFSWRGRVFGKLLSDILKHSLQLCNVIFKSTNKEVIKTVKSSICIGVVYIFIS